MRKENYQRRQEWNYQIIDPCYEQEDIQGEEQQNHKEKIETIIIIETTEMDEIIIMHKNKTRTSA